jgi:hypothetical protein
LWIAALKISEHIWKKIEAGGFVGAEDQRALDDVAAVGYDLDGFVAEAKKALGVVEENFTGGSQLDGFGGAVEETSTIGLLKLANLGADSGLGAENLLPGSREAF